MMMSYDGDLFYVANSYITEVSVDSWVRNLVNYGSPLNAIKRQNVRAISCSCLL